MSNQDDVNWHPKAELLLRKAGISGSFKLVAIPGGRNNKVFKLVVGNQAYLLKSYFHHTDDTRDRLGQEFAFLEHLQFLNSKYTATPYARDSFLHLALMEFIDGKRPSLESITEYEIDHAAKFFIETNKDNITSSAINLLPASEACFCLNEHIQKTQKRIDRLTGIVVIDDIDRKALDFSQKEIVPLWIDVRRLIERKHNNNLDYVLGMDERCLSPSDFGFHNSLINTQKTIRFVDFEYAGWDDPAKLVCDFANQPDMLLSRNLSDCFKKRVIGRFEKSVNLSERIAILEPLYQIKWTCICLNDFLAMGRIRRDFTDGESSQDSRKRLSQLERAKTMLSRALFYRSLA